MKTTRESLALVMAAAALMFPFCEVGSAANISWTNTAGGNWSVAANWSGGVLPTAADDVFITAAGTYTVTQDVHATVANLTLGGSTGQQHLTNVVAVLAVNGAASIQSSGVLGLNGGQVGGTGAVSVSGTLQWSAGTLLTPVAVTASGLFDLVGSTDKAFYQTVTNHGTMRWSGPHNLYMAGAAIMNSSEGTFEVRNSQVMLWNGGGPVVINAGLIRKSANPGTTTLSSVPLINTGTVEVQGGVLNHSGGSQFLEGSILTGTGTNLLATGAVLLHGAIQSQNLEVTTGATIYGTNTLSGAARWTGGVLANTCDLTVANGSSLHVTGTAERRLDGWLRNRGAITWTGANTFIVAYGAIDNQAGGTFDVRNDQVMIWAGGSPAFFNAGLLRKSAGAGMTTFDRVVLVNRGTVEVQTGVFNHSQGSQFLDGTVLTGTGINLLASGTMLFDGTIHSDNVELAAGALIGTNTLTGTLRWTGGVLGSICDLSVTRGSTLEVTGTAERRLDGILRNQGAITWTGSNTFYVAYGTIDNQAGGIFDVRNDQAMVWAGGSPLFLNAGLLRKSAGAGMTTFDRVVLVNRGTVEVQTGILNHSQGSQFLDGTTMTGAGINLLASGTILFDGTIHSDNAELAGVTLIGTNTLIGTARWTGGVLGSICDLMVAHGSTLEVAGTAERRLDGILRNQGTVRWTGSNTFYVAYGAIDNQADGTFDVRNDQAMVWAGGSPLFLNAGLLRKSAGGAASTWANVVLVNRGTVEVQSGILIHSQGSQFLDGTILTGAGTNLLASGTMLFDGTIHSDNAELAAGALIGTNTLTGTLRWTGGVIGTVGVMTVASNATLQLTGTADRRLDGYLVNRGLIAWTGSNIFYVANGGIDNQAGGLFMVANNQAIAWAGGSPFFNNAGTFRKSAGAGFTDLNGVSFQNTGTVDAQTGIIRFLSSYTQTSGRLRFGLSSLTNFGQVQFAQRAPLTGTLAANLLDGFRPKAGDAFAVISYFPSSTGGFTAFDLPNEAAWQTDTSIYGANTVTLTVLNARPAMDPIADKSIGEQFPLQFTIYGTDPDAGQILTYALIDPPEGAGINASFGLFLWFPSEEQGPSTNSIKVRVTDNGMPALSATNTFPVVVHEVNRLPRLVVPSVQPFDELTTLIVTNSATDPDIPANTFRFVLVSAPTGVNLDTNTGVLTWRPTEAQGPGTNIMILAVIDNGVPWLSFTNRLTVTVREVNLPPALVAPGDQIVVPGGVLSFTNAASDQDLPVNALSFSLPEHPAEAIIDAGTGVLTWPTTASDAGTTNRFTVIVRDNGLPSLGATQSFQTFVLPLPRLAISRTDNAVQLSWPTFYSEFLPQSSMNLNPPLVWVAYTNPVSVIGTNRVVIDPITANQKHYRLKHP